LELFVGFEYQGIKPEIVTYNALISACEKGKDLRKALQFRQCMQRQDIKPTLVTFNALISALARRAWTYLRHCGIV